MSISFVHQGWADLQVQAARTLLTKDDTDPKRIFEGEALLRRMYKYGLLDESQNKLDYVLALTPQDFLERRLETLVFKLGLAKSIHHARVLIRQRHIRQVSNLFVAWYVTYLDSCFFYQEAWMLWGRIGKYCSLTSSSIWLRPPVSFSTLSSNTSDIFTL